MRRLILLAIDVFSLGTATLGALWLRENLQIAPARLADLLPYAGLSMLVACLVFPIFGTHRGIWRFSNLRTYLNLSVAVLVTIVVAVAAGFAIDRMDGVARSIPIIQGMLAIGLMSGIRVLLRLRQMARSSVKQPAVAATEPSETVLLHGINAIAELYIRSLKELAPGRVHLAGILGRSDRHSGRLFNEVPVLGTPEQAAEIVRDLATHGVFVNRILLTSDIKDLTPEAREALRDVERSSDVSIENIVDRLLPPPVSREGTSSSSAAPDRADLSLRRVLDEDHLLRPYWRLKRALDIVVSLVLLVGLFPVIALLWFATVVDVGRPAIFWQQRPGRYGKPFRVFKFRTMRAAHDSLGYSVPDADRTSAFGGLLRKTRLDELPQLWNIFVGQMSFIGPRPLLPIDQLNEHSARLAVPPGLTGWAQVNGGREISPDDKAALDVWYIHNASFMLDAKIALLTVRMVLFGEKTDREAISRAWQTLRKATDIGGEDLFVVARGGRR